MTVSAPVRNSSVSNSSVGGSNSNLTPGQQALVASVQQQVSQLLSTQLDGNFQMITYPAGFNYAVTYGAGGYYNPATLATVDSLIAPTSSGTLSLTGGAFHTTYNEILQAASYQYSTADAAVINAPNVAAQAQAILSAAQSDGYPITTTYAAVLIDVVKNNVGPTAQVTPANLAAAAQAILALYPDLGAALSSYAQQLSPQLAIINRQRQAALELAAAQANSQIPTAANGGLATSATAFGVAYTPLPTDNQVLGGLNGPSTVSVQIDVSNFSSNSTNFQVNGGASFSIPIFDVASIGIGGNASYDMSRYTSQSSSLSITMDFKGVYMFSTKPTPLSADYSQGWYDNDLLSSIVSGSGNAAVSGFKIPTSSQYNIAATFGTGKTFSRLKTFVISQQPTITLRFKGANSSQLTQDFKQSSSANITLFGLFKVGQINQSYQVSNVSQDSASGAVTIVLAPPAQQGTIPLEAQVAYVLGGVASYPPTNI